MDTCGALNTGYLLFHLWLMPERPDLVAEFISFDDANPFEPVKLGGAIYDPADFDSSTRGNLTAVIRHCTPHIDNSGSPIALSFALGADITVNAIFGLPVLCDLDSVISLCTNSLHRRALSIGFPIIRASATFGLPPGCQFDAATAARIHSSARALEPPLASLDSPPSIPSAALTMAVNDMSLGFLQRSIHPSS
jgi:hypothetical protein